MKPIKLSERLSHIARFIPQGKKVADIGSDHALLPSYLIKQNISPHVIAGEVNEGPYQAAKKQISSLLLENRISVRKGDGLSVIDKHEVDVITIAGMGGALIAEILNKGEDKLEQIERMVLQPNVGSELVRKWLDTHRWNIISEEILEEDDKIYEIIVAEHREGLTDNAYISQIRTKEELYRIGPLLWKNKSLILLKKWEQELNKNKYILNQLNQYKNNDEKDTRKLEIQKEIEWIMEVITCLQKGKALYKSLNS